MNSGAWETEFRAVWQRAVAAYENGADTADRCIGAEDRAFLASIGVTAQELFDFAEDWVGYGEPSVDEVTAVTAIQRDHFLTERQARPPGPARSARSFPAKTDAVEGIAWLPRLIVKTRAKLAGELPSELMYGCGGDRPFLRELGIGLAEFFAKVRDSKGDDRAVVEFVKGRMKKR